MESCLKLSEGFAAALEVCVTCVLRVCVCVCVCVCALYINISLCVYLCVV